MTRRPPKTLGSALIAFLALLLASAALGQEAIVSARIVGMTDDDTIKALAEGYQLLRVRLSWIDAPENSQAFGQRSKQHLSELIFGREVELHTHGLDQYGRTLAVIFVNGMDANLEQVRSGMTWVYERYVIQAGPDIQVSYRQAETEAWQQQPDSGVNRTPFRRGNIGTLART
jgi:endonuclease YncB( thermonuclease family)